MNYVREYWERISSGEIVTSRRVKAVYGRLVAEMDAADESSPYYFDEAVGERPIIFVERFCKQSQGTLGESLTLELFQKAYIQLLFGWLERATGYRRFRETLFLVGRKNGKSTLLAALALYMLVADFVERAKKNPEDLPGVLCKDFNVKATGAASWLSYEDAVNEATFKPEEVYNTYAIGGCDLSATTDLTCATLIIRRSSDDEIVYVFQHYFLPQKKIDQLDEHNTQEAPYKIWAERGLVTICEGTRVDYSAVTAWYCQMRDELKIDAFKIGYDRALAGYWVDEMKANGFDMCAVAQGPFTWSQPMRELGAALADKKVNYNKNPVLLWCLTNTGVKKSGVNNIQPVKISEKRRIDGMVSLLNAWVIYVRDYEDYMYLVG